MLRRFATFCLLLILCHAAAARAQDGGDLLSRVNNLRASLGLPPYRLNAALSAAAQGQAEWMAATGTISHARPDGSGPRTRALAAGYPSSDVTENIYGGTNASPDAAWAFWVNSPVHYNGMTNARYQEIGIGSARSSSMTTYVLMFGNPGGPEPMAAAQPGASRGGSRSAPPAQPSYVVGLDPFGNIMHEVQPGDTLGDIALIYGYTWSDIPYMKELNNIEDHRALVVGSIFLVPPRDGTYTPTPDDAPPAATAPAADEPATLPPTTSPTATPEPTRLAIATAAAMPEVIAMAAPVSTATPDSAGMPVALAAGAAPAAASTSTIARNAGAPPVLGLALALQVGLLIAAGVEFARRWRRQR
ncbi:MAG: CAP domain-containing protein [Aggregatilineales bacterium]